MTAPFRVVALGDMDHHIFPPTRWICDELFPAGALVLVVGRPKAGKSLLMVDLLASIAEGAAFLDRATEQGPTIYAAAEDAFALVRERSYTRFSSDRAAPYHVLPADGSFPDQSLRLDDDGESLMRLAATIDALRPVAICLDPFRELHGSKENDADAMALLLRPLRQLAHETGTTVFLVHHRNKHGLDAGTAARGSSAITGSVDVVVTLDVRGNDEEELTPDQTVTIRAEGRYGPRQKIVARLGTGLRWQVTTALAPDMSLPGRIVAFLAAHGAPFTAEGVTGGLNAKHGSVQNALAALVKAGKVARLGKGTKAAPFVYGSPDVTNCDESPQRACDESCDEYSPAAQGKTGIRHNPTGYTHEEYDESSSPRPATPGMTNCDESCDESAPVHPPAPMASRRISERDLPALFPDYSAAATDD